MISSRPFVRIVAITAGALLGALGISPPAASLPSAPPAAAGGVVDGTGLDVVPRPTLWEPGTGTTAWSDAGRIVVDASSADQWSTGPEQPGLSHRTTLQVAESLADELSLVTGTRPSVVVGTTPTPSDVVVRLVDRPGLGAEGYELTVGDGPVAVTAATSTGVYYAGRTVQQMLSGSTDGRTLQNGTVRDVPDQAYRQVMLDSGRKYWEPAYLKDLIRQMSWMKLNALFLQFSDAEGFRLDSPAFPGLADPSVSYDESEIADLVAFARRHHVMLVPGIDVPGHSTVLSNYFDIGFGRGLLPCQTHSHVTPDWALDLTNPRATSTTRDLLTEFVPWFEAPYFHLGADELPSSLGLCPRVITALLLDLKVSTLGDLLARFINDADDVINGLGKRTIIYSGVESTSTPQQDVDDDVIFMTWQGTNTEPIVAGHDEILVSPFYVTPNTHHNRYPDVPWAYDVWAPSAASEMLGSGLMNWADYNFWANDQYFERQMAAPRAVVADRTWNASSTPDDVAQFHARVAEIGSAPGVVPVEPRRRDDDTPSHRWTFEPASYPSGWTYAGSPGNTLLADDVAGDLPGTSYINDNPVPVTGVVGQAWQFDHERDGVGFGGLDIAPPWTVSAWVRRADATTNTTLLSSQEAAIMLSQQNSCGQVGLTEKGAAAHTFDYVLPAGEWVHLTFVATPGSTDLFVNGEFADSLGVSVDLPLRSVGDVGSSVQGDLDELVTFDVPLTPDTVRSKYAAYSVQGSNDPGVCAGN